MVNYKKRLELESKELKVKINKLGSFLYSEAIDSIDDEEKRLMNMQLNKMESYLSLLNQRIDKAWRIIVKYPEGEE